MMPRVASLYLPFLATERIARRARPDILPVADGADGGSRGPRGTDGTSRAPTPGWRPGARWSRDEAVAAVEAEIARLPLHQRPPIRELGRRSEAMPTPFRAMPRDEAGGLRPTVLDVPPHAFADTTKLARAGSNAPAYGGDRAAPLRQMIREFPTMPDRGRWDRDAGGSRRMPSTKEMCGYDLEGAFWQSPHAIAGEVRSRWDDPDSFTKVTAKRSAPPSAAPFPSGPPPLVTAIRDGARMVIAAACPIAQRQGLAPGQPLATARALVPGLDVRDSDPDGDRAALHRLALHAVRHWSPLAAPSDPTGLWIEASAAPLHGGEERLCARILRTLRRHGHDARIAIADTAGAAHALARHGGTRITLCPPGAQGDAIARLPIAALRLEAEAEARLRRLGVEDIAALDGIARAPLVRRFGRGVAHRLDQALGARPEPIEGVLPPETPQARCSFVEPISTADEIATALARLVGELCGTLTTRGLGARRVALQCRRVDDRDEIETIGTAAATRDPAHLLRLLCARIEKIDPGFGLDWMRLIALRCDRLGPRAHRTLDDNGTPDLALLVDILATRLGPTCLYRIGAIESDIPERSVARAHPLGTPPPAHPDWPRPLRLLTRPEPLIGVLAELPDHPPRHFRWRGTLHTVTRGDGPERIHGEWWRAKNEVDAVRDYFAVEDDAGRRFWLFRRGDGNDARTGDMSWHLHGMFGT